MKTFLNTAVLSAEVAECGLACMTMIARSNGIQTSIHDLKEQFPSSASGNKASDLLTIGCSIGLYSTALRVELEDLYLFRMPVIAHWKFNHFVVIREANRKRLLIDDPEAGRLKIPLTQAGKSFTGVILEFSPDPSRTVEIAKSSRPITALWRSIPHFKRDISFAIGLAFLTNVASLLLPLQGQILIDASSSRVSASSIPFIAAVFALLSISLVLLDMLRTWHTQWTVTNITTVVMGRVINYLMRLPLSFFLRRHTGDILSRLQSARSIQESAPALISSALFDLPLMAMSIFMITRFSTTLAIIVLVFGLISAALSYFFSHRIRADAENVLTAQSFESTNIIETLRAMPTVKGMAYEPEREASWRYWFSHSVQSQFKLFRTTLAWRNGAQLISSLQTLAVVGVGATIISLNHALTVGMLVAILSYRQIFAGSAGNVATQFTQLRVSLMNYERLKDIIGTPIENEAGDLGGLPVAGQIELVGVAFAYGRFEPRVISGASLMIAPGEMVALVGPSGGGKSTLVQLMQGLLIPTEGQIIWDGQPATSLGRAWRRHVGIVSQDDSLLAGTIAENIASFSPNLDMDSVVRAASQCAMHHDIVQFPMQYRSLVGDLGSALSGGQKQRLLLARALYRNPKVLFLDEGTANLDANNEQKIANLIRGLPITRIVVAHRPALVDIADRVFEVAGGTIRQIRP